MECGGLSVATPMSGVLKMQLLFAVNSTCLHPVTVYHKNCFTLSFITDASVLPFSVFGSASSGPVLLDSVHCTGNEDGLLDCPHSSIGNHFCTQYSPIVAIKCQGTLSL